MSVPLVSIAIPTYNRAALVRRAIDSALGQTYPRIEVIVVDDGSTDNTMATLQAYSSPSVRVVRHAANKGATAAKNTGIDAMTGAFCAILDSDDELLPDAVERILAVFERLGPSVGVVFANCVDPATGAWTGKGLTESQEVTFRDAITGRFSGEFWGVWRREALGARRLDPTLPGGSESLVWHDMYRSVRFYYLHEAVRKYARQSPDSVSAMNLEPEHLARTRLMYERYLDQFGDDMRRLDPRAYAKQVQLIALWHLLEGNRMNGIARLLESVRAAPGPRLALVAIGMALTPAALLRQVFQWRLRRKVQR